MTAHEKVVCDKYIRLWHCPFCDCTLTVIKPDHMDSYSKRHLEDHYGEVSEDDMRIAMHSLGGHRVPEVLRDIILTKEVLKRL